MDYTNYDAEGVAGLEPCPECASEQTVTYVYREGFREVECHTCGYSSEAEEIGRLTRYRGDLAEGSRLPPIPLKKIEA